MKKLLKLSRNENGQVLVLAALFMTVLMGFAAFAVDIGMVTVTKSKLQNTADAAALAGAASVGKEESTAKSYATINGLDDTEEGTEIDVEVDTSAASVTGSTTKKAYTAAEITQKLSELETELNAKGDNDLIEIANEMSVTTGLKTEAGTYEAEDFRDTTDTELIEMAKANSLLSYLDVKEETKSDEEMMYTTWAALKAELDNMKTHKEIIDYAANSNPVIDISEYIKNDGFQNDTKKNGAINKILKTKYPNEKVTIYSIPHKGRDTLVNAIVDKLNETANPVEETKITDKIALVTKLLEVQKKIWEEEEVTVGQKKGGSTQVKVTLEKKVSYTFARILGFTEGTVSVHAVAEKTAWAGEDALPFINLDDKYGTPGLTLTGWNKVGPGDKERIHNDDLIIPPDKSTIKVNYEDGSIMFKKGKDNSIGDALENILVVGKTVYLFSLSNEVIDSKSYEKGEENELKNKDLIPLSDIVLLECEVTEFQNKLITLKFVKSYDWDASKNTFMTPTGEKPDDSIRLVE